MYRLPCQHGKHPFTDSGEAEHFLKESGFREVDDFWLRGKSDYARINHCPCGVMVVIENWYL